MKIILKVFLLLGLTQTLWAQNTPGDEIFNGDKLFNDVKQYVNFGVHRTATNGDNATSAWLKNKLDGFGFRTEYLYFPVKQYFLESAALKINNSIVDVFPLWPVATANVTLNAELVDADKHKQPVSGKIAVIRLKKEDRKYIDRLEKLDRFNDLIAQHASAIVLIVDNDAGEIAALNTQPKASWKIPVVQIAPKDTLQLVEGARVSLQIKGKLKDVQARNVIAKIGSGKQTVIVSTPISGWFTCGGERGPGIAIFNAIAKWVSVAKPPYTFVFVANSSHELEDHRGTHVFIDKKAPKPSDVRLWVHLGASFAINGYQKSATSIKKLETVDPKRKVYYSSNLENTMHQAFDRKPITQLGNVALGELSVAAKYGYAKYFGFVGADFNPFFHTPVDNETATSPEILEETALMIRDAIQLELVQHL